MATADLPRMNERQFSRAKKLLCRYFRAAVLPADRELCEEILGCTLMRHCIICGRPIFRPSNAAKYCVNCAARERRKRDAARKRKRRLDVRKSGL